MKEKAEKAMRSFAHYLSNHGFISLFFVMLAFGEVEVALLFLIVALYDKLNDILIQLRVPMVMEIRNIKNNVKVEK